MEIETLSQEVRLDLVRFQLATQAFELDADQFPAYLDSLKILNLCADKAIRDLAWRILKIYLEKTSDEINQLPDDEWEPIQSAQHELMRLSYHVRPRSSEETRDLN